MNYVRNRVTFYGKPERINAVKSMLKTEDSQFDFNNIIPMPESLNLLVGSWQHDAIKLAQLRRKLGSGKLNNNKEALKIMKDHPWIRGKTCEECADYGEKYLKNEELYVYQTYDDWRPANWGTPFNSCGAEWEGDSVEFETGVSHPDKIYRKIAELFPDVDFEVSFADEDLYGECGTVDYYKGDYDLTFLNSVEFACHVWNIDPKKYMDEEVSSDVSCDNY